MRTLSNCLTILGSTGLAAFCAAILPALTVHAAELRVRVVDRDGRPVPEVVVAAEGRHSQAHPPPSQAAIMDQVDRRFVPGSLVIQAGTAVAFPNSDTVSHQVYSLSSAKRDWKRKRSRRRCKSSCVTFFNRATKLAARGARPRNRAQ